MKTEKAYTKEQMANANRTMAFLAALPEDRRLMAIMVTNAFIAGMEAQERMIAQRMRKEGAKDGR